MTEADVRRWMDRAREYLQRFRHHPEFDDILGSAFCRMAVGLSRYPDHPDLTAIALRHAWLGALDFLRSSASSCRIRTVHGQPLPVTVPLTEVRASTPDFVPALLTRLELQSELARLPPQERRMLIGLAQGYSRSEIADQMDVSPETVRIQTRCFPQKMITRRLRGTGQRPERSRIRVSHCANCGISRAEANRFRHDHCHNCYQYHWRTGKERPRELWEAG